MQRRRGKRSYGSVRNNQIYKMCWFQWALSFLGHVNMGEISTEKAAEAHSGENSVSDAQPQAQQTQPNIEPPLHNIM